VGSTPRGISASRGAAVLGLSDWATPLEVWQLIMEERDPPVLLAEIGSSHGGAGDWFVKMVAQGLDPTGGYPGYNAAHGYTCPEFKEGAPLRWGTAFEDAVVSLAEEGEGLPIGEREKLYEYGQMLGDDRALITCHIDGHYRGTDRLHEGKTTNAMSYREKWGEPGSDRIPREYAVQVQHQMLCTGAAEVIVSVLVFPEMPDAWEKMGWQVREAPGQEIMGSYQLWKGDTFIYPIQWARTLQQMGYFHTYRVKANPEAQGKMLAAYRDFWTNNVLGGVPPEPRTYEDIKRLFPEPKGTLVCGELMARLLKEYADIKDELGGKGMLSRRADEIKLLVLDWARTADPTMDDESREATIFRDEAGKKLGSFGRDKRGSYIFRT